MKGWGFETGQRIARYTSTTAHRYGANGRTVCGQLVSGRGFVGIDRPDAFVLCPACEPDEPIPFAPVTEMTPAARARRHVREALKAFNALTGHDAARGAAKLVEVDALIDAIERAS